MSNGDAAEAIEHAEKMARRWQEAIDRQQARLEINGDGIKEIYQLTNQLRNLEASRQAMRLISNEVTRLHRVADEALQVQNETTRALLQLNQAIVDLAARMLALEEQNDAVKRLKDQP